MLPHTLAILKKHYGQKINNTSAAIFVTDRWRKRQYVLVVVEFVVAARVVLSLRPNTAWRVATSLSGIRYFLKTSLIQGCHLSCWDSFARIQARGRSLWHGSINYPSALQRERCHKCIRGQTTTAET